MKLINQTKPQYKFQQYKDLKRGDLFFWVHSCDKIDYNNLWFYTGEYNETTLNDGIGGVFRDNNRVIALKNIELHYELETANEN